MAEWKHEIDIRDAWKTNDVGVISDAIIKELKGCVRLVTIPDVKCINYLIEQFENLKENPSIRRLDYLMSLLYNWGDSASVWIATVV